MSEPECLQCRLIGGSALTATGAYAIWSSRPKAIGSPVGKRLVGLMGGVLLIAGINRSLPALREYHRVDQSSDSSVSPQPTDKS